MARTKLNIALLKRLRTRFLRMRHPSHFRMQQIAIKTDCGAAMCMIGHVLDLEGYKMRLKKHYDPRDDDDLWGPNDSARSDYDFISPSGRKVREPLNEARRLLGLDRVGERFFYEYDLQTPKQAAERIQQIIETGEV